MRKIEESNRCGTPAGWQKHKYRGEKPCDACATAKREYDKRRRSSPENARKNRLAARAQGRAEMRLRHLYPDIYRVLYEQALQEVFKEERDNYFFNKEAGNDA